MADYRNVDIKPKTDPDPDPNLAKANHAATSLIDENSRQLDHRLLARLHDAVLAPTLGEGRSVVRQAVMSGVRSEDIADYYIPTLARSFGDLWCEDEMSFAEVTIAVSRLQSILRDLEAFWPGANAPGSQSVATLLLIVPRDMFHTLGAFVLTGQLRRRGISVKMVLGGNTSGLADELRACKFDAIFVSASQSDSLVSLRGVVDAVQAATRDTPPVVVGGKILDVVSAETLMAETGADHATGNTEEALRHCGVLLTTRDDAPAKKQG